MTNIHVLNFRVVEDGEQPELVMTFQVANGEHAGKHGTLVVPATAFQIDGVEGGDGS